MKRQSVQFRRLVEEMIYIGRSDHQKEMGHLIDSIYGNHGYS